MRKSSYCYLLSAPTGTVNDRAFFTSSLDTDSHIWDSEVFLQ
jgi:hypothetical protein